MKKPHLLFFLLLIRVLSVYAQEENGGYANWDIEGLFEAGQTGQEGSTDDPEGKDRSAEDNANGEGSKAIDIMGIRGFSAFASIYFMGAYAPGWSETPWNGEYGSAFSQPSGVAMEGDLGLDLTISRELQVKTVFVFSFPGFAFTVNQFFLNYNFSDRLFFRIGKFVQNWGYSPNYPFTNLPIRVPASKDGDSYIARIEIPVGIGGLQLLSMTRDGYLAKTDQVGIKELAFGAKYNLAFPWADIDLGGYYFEEMPLRFFYSVKTTITGLFDTEVYTEGMFAVNHQSWDHPEFSLNAGFINSFFQNKLAVNGEVYYNGETNAYWYEEKNIYNEPETNTLVGGFNFALNITYKPGWKGFNLFTRARYNLEQNSLQLIPGIRIVPLSHITVTMAVPMALGSRDGYYYTESGSADKYGRPFSILLGVSINGSFNFEKYNFD
ncbi:MAG: hypothetical protein LBQ44_08375 [Treponema sp.]|nr:hypothetical protein [Treponema sp.]